MQEVTFQVPRVIVRLLTLRRYMILREFMQKTFVTTAPSPSTSVGNSGDNGFSSITALLKALLCWDLLRVITLLIYKWNKFQEGYILCNITSLALRGTSRAHCPTQMAAIPSPSSLLQMTGALLIKEQCYYCQQVSTVGTWTHNIRGCGSE